MREKLSEERDKKSMPDIIVDVVALIHISKTTTRSTSLRTSKRRVQTQRDDDVSDFTAIERDIHEARCALKITPSLRKVDCSS